MNSKFDARSFAARALILVALFLTTSSFLTAQTATQKAAKFDEVMALASKYKTFNGAVLVAENGKVIYKKGFGLANMEWNIPNTPETRFRLGSITKQFTATLILQLVEQGKIKLDGKLSDYLPDYRKDVGEKVTIHQLLTHTSGIPSYTGLPGFIRDVSRNPYTVDEFVKKFASNDLEFEPGSKFSYNNSGYFLLGAIIEKITGRPYEQVIKEKIFEPLGMKNSGYDHAATILEKRASGYIKTRDGYLNAPYLDMSLPYAAGSLYSTVEDLFLWDQALYTDRLLSEQSKAVMYKPYLQNYAYGWVITKAKLGSGPETVTSIGHNGGINGFNTLLVRYPEQRNLIVLLDNTSQGASLDRLAGELTNILYNQPYSLPRMPLAETLLKTIQDQGIAAGVTQYRDLKAKQPNVYDFTEPQLNQLGYQLLQTNKRKEAIEIFKLNVEAYPQSANVYDSLGEAYMVEGNNEQAIVNYKKSLELNPQSPSGALALKRLTSPAPVVDTKVYDTYVGEYEVSPTFKLTVFRDGERLMSQATGQPTIELFPESADNFYLKVVAAKVTFTRDEKGVVTGLVVHQGGRDIIARKTK
jgi:CubicO group peptidase (beta-lactamase class C family)